MIKNFRDISKYNTKLINGVVFRSSAPCLYKDNLDIESILRSKNVSTIIDLRADREIKEIYYHQDQHLN